MHTVFNLSALSVYGLGAFIGYDAFQNGNFTAALLSIVGAYAFDSFIIKSADAAWLNRNTDGKWPQAKPKNKFNPFDRNTYKLEE